MTIKELKQVIENGLANGTLFEFSQVMLTPPVAGAVVSYGSASMEIKLGDLHIKAALPTRAVDGEPGQVATAEGFRHVETLEPEPAPVEEVKPAGHPDTSEENAKLAAARGE